MEFVLPIRSFSDGYVRLANVLSVSERRELARSIAQHVSGIVSAYGSVICVTRDAEVAEWAARAGFSVVTDPGSGLNDACAIGVTGVESRWAVLHADLPYLSHDDVRAALGAVAGDNVVLAPTHDGGTSFVSGADSRFRFSYGVGSFHRHLAHAGRHVAIVMRKGLALDLDTSADLRRWQRSQANGAL